MHFRFLLSDPHGDRELSREDLEQPFLTSPSEKHPFLTLKDYFGALQEFIMPAGGNHFRFALAKKLDLQDSDFPAAISEVLIRSEKHGAFYHIASAALLGQGKNIKFAVTTALSESARASLQEEYGISQQLSGISPDYLPELFCRETVTWDTDSGAAEFLMVAGEWLDGYHEWHLSPLPEAQKQKIQLWDYENGYRFLSDEESYEVLRRAAFILTYYYDQASFCQIYPWHHGAGDFVVNAEPGAVKVKLITARQYEPLVYFDAEEDADRLVAAIHFLLNLGLRIRLDRRDGVGDPAWLEDFAVHAAVAGFFTGLDAANAADRLMIGPVADFLEIMQSFDAREIYDMYESLLEIYAEEDQDDLRLIRAKLTDHAADLHAALKSFSLQRP
jgi:hypothetical protein